ncbi:hypothetical protein A9Q87_13665 [Flavobacteriales bacterium 34_180_T64]|nr:hypothetical protein A9Q87_13665 [Flavobacteriales bacterium 34_180_T64]
MPFFTVVIPVFNKASFIERTLNSVIHQSFKDFEIIIIDDGSTDESLNIINSFNDPRITIFSVENKGVSASRNHGISKANTNYIALLDADDFWEPNFLETIKLAISAYPDESIFTTALAHKFDNKVIASDYNFSVNSQFTVLNYFRNSLKHQLLTSSSMVFKTSIIEITGLFDTNLESGEDTDLWIRFGLHYDVVFINKILAYYNHNNNSLSKSNLDLNAKPKFDKYLSEEKENKDLKKLLDKNRFSLAILSKLHNNKSLFEFYKNSLAIENLNLKQRLLLQCPKQILQLFLKLKSLNGTKLYHKPL